MNSENGSSFLGKVIMSTCTVLGLYITPIFISTGIYIYQTREKTRWDTKYSPLSYDRVEHQSARVIARNHLTNKLGKHFRKTLPENGCLENEFPFQMAHFQVRTVNFREGNSQNLNVLWTLWVIFP